MTDYLRSIGWDAGTYDTAIGIRADELDRVSPTYKEKRIVYPLVNAGIRKDDVLAFWAKQPFDLEVPEHRGNCTWCWKKSLRKHLTLAKEDPAIFDFPARMEAEYPNAGAGDAQRVFFRERMTAKQIVAMSQKPFVPFTPSTEIQLPLLEMDEPNGCEESCEVYS